MTHELILSIISLQRFVHNLYTFANELYLPLLRQHLLVESRVTPDMILPYLQVCLQLCAEAYAPAAEQSSGGGAVEGPDEVVVECPALSNPVFNDIVNEGEIVEKDEDNTE